MYKLLKEASLLTLVAFLLSACGGSLNEGNTDVADDGPSPSREWQLVWSDEFEGTELDLLTGKYSLVMVSFMVLADGVTVKINTIPTRQIIFALKTATWLLHHSVMACQCQKLTLNTATLIRTMILHRLV